MLHSLSQGVAILPRTVECCATMAWFSCCALMPQLHSHLGQHGCHGTVMLVWCCGIMARFWICTVMLWYPSYGQVSSMRFHWPWAHMYCLPDLVILVSTLQTHSSLTFPWCAPSPWPDASGAKKLQWVQRYVQKSGLSQTRTSTDPQPVLPSAWEVGLPPSSAMEVVAVF